jgi:hypothetical protein
MLGDELTSRKVAEEPHLGLEPKPRGEKICDFGHHQNWHNRWAGMLLKQAPTSVVFVVVAVIGGIERPGVDDQRAASSDPRISSMRCEMSCLPLAPGLPRRLFRGPPIKWFSIASRVSSETVIPRRSASCRSRLSIKSGSLTVVRFMGMPAYHKALGVQD